MTEQTATRHDRRLAHAPLSDEPLPAWDPAIPSWPGGVETFGDLRLHVRRTPGPDDTTAVFVHGLSGSSTNWTDLAALLSGHANGVAVDLPGTGESEPLPGYRFTLDEFADTVARALRATGEGPVHLFGNSLGGAVSMVLAARHPDLVRTLTLISPAVPDRRPLPGRMSDPRLALALLPVIGAPARGRLAALSPRARVEQVQRLCFADPSTVPETRIEEAARELVARSRHPWNGPALTGSTLGLLRAWFAPRSRSLWAVAERIKAPTLVVWGTEDRLVTARKAPKVARLIPRARLLVLPRTGHVAQMERPVTVARAVLAMWRLADDGKW
ncbi:alpha/beta fold hydrolase [Labedaea rhizosphaerae]|uniref:Pimeloyl-ACP methyl ester carboxylesterase n=1 Tax=Labedaea rhizosphaerae TaxID=598644 RepID=A0A4R6S3T8_LABRH|nr:alpha/beta fold hydrolase [Labedaea rhizosphaerae]TDP93884.1 pimeloyl-ACP methyl ester carboxylesterase [Labedaea rhizosphaerae]